MQTWHVYQLRSDTELLYVGYSRQLKTRMRQHRLEKPWWPEVTDVRSEEFATEDEARQREKELWASEQPKYNQVNPFLTPEEELQRNREKVRKQRQKPGFKQYQREYNQLPRTRQRKREYARRKYARRGASGLGKRWQQTGPGLF